MEQEHFQGSSEWSLTESQDPAGLRLCQGAIRASWRLWCKPPGCQALLDHGFNVTRCFELLLP